MDELKNDIVAEIKHRRPKLSDNSIKTYVSILSNLYKKLDADGGIDFFKKNVKGILHSLGEKHSKTRKSVLAALFVLTEDSEYREQMLSDCKVVNDMYKEQKKDPKQVENWIDIKEIEHIYNQLKDTAQKMLDKKIQLDSKLIMDWLLIGLLGGVSGLSPRRSLDYSVMKIRNYSKTDNYYKAGKFYFNIYKTAGKYGAQEMAVPPELNKMLKKWIKFNDTDYLLFSSNKNILSSSQITRTLNKIFGKNVSTDMLRHIFLTETYKNVPALQSMEALATEMGHSMNTALEYVKK